MSNEAAEESIGVVMLENGKYTIIGAGHCEEFTLEVDAIEVCAGIKDKIRSQKIWDKL